MKRFGVYILLLSVLGCVRGKPPAPALDATTAPDAALPEAFREPKNVVFPEMAFDPARLPTVTLLSPPWPERASAVWGSLGRDRRGHIFVGASCESASGASAWLSHAAKANEMSFAGRPSGIQPVLRGSIRPAARRK